MDNSRGTNNAAESTFPPVVNTDYSTQYHRYDQFDQAAQFDQANHGAQDFDSRQNDQYDQGAQYDQADHGAQNFDSTQCDQYTQGAQYDQADHGAQGFNSRQQHVYVSEFDTDDQTQYDQYDQGAQYDEADYGAQGFNSTQHQAYVSETADEEYDPNQQCDYAAPTPDNAPPTPLRFPLQRYIPANNYFDCDMYYLVRNAGVDKENCFGCAQPTTVCKLKFPHCQGKALCIFCQERFDTHPQENQFCITLWATTAFLKKYAGWMNTSEPPQGQPIKPNPEEAKYLAEQGYMSIHSYYDHTVTKKDFYKWLNPPREPRIPIHDFGAASASQKKKFLSTQRKAINAKGYGNTMHKQRSSPGQPVTLAKGTKRAFDNKPTDDMMPPPSSFTNRRREEYDNSNYGHGTSSRFDQFAQNAPQTSPFNQDRLRAQRAVLPLPTRQQGLQSGPQSSMYSGPVHRQANRSTSDGQPTSTRGSIPPWPGMTTRGASGRDYSDHAPRGHGHGRGPGRGDGRGRGRGRGSY